MGAIKEFNDLHLPLRVIAIGIFLLMPFWYLDIYIFSRNIIASSQTVQIPIVISFCLSVVWLFANIIFALMISFEEEKDKKVEEEEGSGVIITAVIISVILKSILTFFGYLSKCRFHTFVFASFGVAVFLIISAGIISHHRTENPKKKQNKP